MSVIPLKKANTDVWDPGQWSCSEFPRAVAEKQRQKIIQVSCFRQTFPFLSAAFPTSVICIISRLQTDQRGAVPEETKVASDFGNMARGEYCCSANLGTPGRNINSEMMDLPPKLWGCALKSTFVAKTWSSEQNIREITISIRLNPSINCSPRDNLPTNKLLFGYCMKFIISWEMLFNLHFCYLGIN